MTAAAKLPEALAKIHAAGAVGITVEMPVPRTDGLTWLLEGAGLKVVSMTDDRVVAVRTRTLPDVVGPGMRILICGLNPSLYSADTGVNFARPGNRFWPAAIEAGLVTVDRDPRHALHAHGVGFTDLVKRATARADELRVDEYRRGAERLAFVVGLLKPSVVCFVGLTGWRAAIDRRANAGAQPEDFAGAAAYVMPNTSGLNAHSRPRDFVEHFEAVMTMGCRG